MIIIGTNNIAAAYVGATAVEKAYVGNNQIYPNTSLTLSASELSFAAAGQSLTLLWMKISPGQSQLPTIGRYHRSRAPARLT